MNTSLFQKTLDFSVPVRAASAIGALARIAPKALEFLRQSVGLVPRRQPQHYRVLDKVGAFEVREYEACLVATVEVTGNFEHAQAQAHARLTKYIYGDNHAQPRARFNVLRVISNPTNPEPSVKIHLTAPILQEQTANGWTMSFVLPERLNRHNAPLPSDQDIHIQRIPAHTAATLRFAGRYDEARIRAASRDLSGWVGEQRLHVVSPLRFAGYNSSVTLPFLRHNEVQFDVVRDLQN